MSRAAVVVAGPARSRAPVAGLTSLARMVRCAEAAGSQRIVILTAGDEATGLASARAGLVPAQRAAPCEAVARGSAEEARVLAEIAGGGERCLLLHSDLALDAGYLKELSREATGDAVVVGAAAGEAPDAAFVLPLASTAPARHAIGVASVPAAALAGFAGERPAATAFAELVAAACREGRLKTFVPQRPHVARLLLDGRDGAAATRELLQLAGKASDGVVSRHLNRRLSTLVTRALLPTGVTPNAVTLGTLAIGLVAGVVLARGTSQGFVLGALLYQLNSALDGCDGEIARLKFQCSRFGEWADSLSDHVANLSFTGGLALGLYRHSGGRGVWLALGGFTTIAYVLTAVVAFLRMRGLRDAAHLSDFGRSVGNALPVGSWRTRAFRVLAAIARRDFYALFFFVLALVGLARTIPFLLALGAAGHLPALFVTPRRSS